MWKYEEIIIFCGVILFLLIFLALWLSERRRQTKSINLAVEKAGDSQRRRWEEVKNVKDLITLYTKMVFKHGPDSDEAKSFRFGAESRQLYDDQASLAAFNEIADLIDQNYRNAKR